MRKVEATYYFGTVPKPLCLYYGAIGWGDCLLAPNRPTLFARRSCQCDPAMPVAWDAPSVNILLEDIVRMVKDSHSHSD